MRRTKKHASTLETLVAAFVAVGIACLVLGLCMIAGA